MLRKRHSPGIHTVCIPGYRHLRPMKHFLRFSGYRLSNGERIGEAAVEHVPQPLRVMPSRNLLPLTHNPRMIYDLVYRRREAYTFAPHIYLTGLV